MDDQNALLPGIEYELLLLSRHRARDRTRSYRRGKSLEYSGYLLLSRLELEHPLSMKEIATALGLDPSTVQRQVAALIGFGLVKNVFGLGSGAIRKVAPTKKGLDALKHHREQSCTDLRESLGDWSEADLGRLRELLLRLNRGMEEREGRAWPRPSSP